jgi:hypothetical protein
MFQLDVLKYRNFMCSRMWVVLFYSFECYLERFSLYCFNFIVLFWARSHEPISFVVSVRLSTCLQRSSHWTDFREILFSKSKFG